MDLVNLLSALDEPSLTGMADALEKRSAALARDDNPAAKAWAKLYGYLSIEMDSAALRQRTGISL